MQSVLDKEWVYLMKIARAIGLTKEEVKDFIQNEKDKEKMLHVKP